MAQIDVPVGSVPEGWGHARLIPTFGIRNQQEQEKRATSCLLAVMHGVPEFGHALLKELDAPKAPTIETFAEVRFKDATGKVVIPDGAIVCRRGKKTWTCLVEVKTGSARLKDEQVSAYLDIARANQFDGVLTVFDADRGWFSLPMTRSGRVTGGCGGRACACAGDRHGRAMRASHRSSGEIGWHVHALGIACANAGAL